MRAAIGIALLLVLALMLIDRSGWLAYPGDDHSRFHRQTVQVVRSEGGDVLVVRSGGDEVRVRLLGVASPDPGTIEYERCCSYLAERTRDRSLVLRLDQLGTRDDAGDLLAYVYINDSDNLNVDLIFDGQAFADRRTRHSLSPQFEMTESEARTRKRGMWKEMTDDRLPEWRKAWLKSLPGRSSTRPR